MWPAGVAAAVAREGAHCWQLPVLLGVTCAMAIVTVAGKCQVVAGWALVCRLCRCRELC